MFKLNCKPAAAAVNCTIVALAAITMVFTSGCSSFGNRHVSGVPVSRLPSGLLDNTRKDDFEDISLLRLRQDPPNFYALGPGDVLGLYIKGITGTDEDLPPVHYPEDSNLPPAVGFPTPVRDDGTLDLPIIDPINVEGMSLIEATNAVREAYLGGDSPVLVDDKEQVSLTMIRRRTVRILVIREESGGVAEVTKRGTGTVVDLPAYENDVLHALSETGGMPGLDAQNEVVVLRGMFDDSVQYDQVIAQAGLDQCQACGHNDPCFCDERPQPDPPNMTRIPLRYHPTDPPNFNQDDILLSDGDIVIIRSRDRETFFSAGLLAAGEHLLPRDKDLDVIGAIAMAGGALGQGTTGISALGQGGGGGRGGFPGGGGGGQGGGILQPSEVLVIRELPCGDQITLKVDLNRALQNRSERVLIKPGDIVMLRYTIGEEIVNAALSLVQFNFLFNGFNGGGF